MEEFELKWVIFHNGPQWGNLFGRENSLTCKTYSAVPITCTVAPPCFKILVKITRVVMLYYCHTPQKAYTKTYCCLLMHICIGFGVRHSRGKYLKECTPFSGESLVKCIIMKMDLQHSTHAGLPTNNHPNSSSDTRLWQPRDPAYTKKKKKGTKMAPLGLELWHRNGSPKGPVLQTVKRCPKGAVLVPLIFLSVQPKVFQVSSIQNSSLKYPAHRHLQAHSTKWVNMRHKP